jgi:serine/threonine protein kinase
MADYSKPHNNPQPPVILAGCRKKHFTLSDLRILMVYMRFFLTSVAVEEINEYFHENMYIFMELTILDVCSMIITHFGILSWAIPDVLDFVMVSLMGYRKHTPLMYIIDGFVFKLRNVAYHIQKDGLLTRTIVLEIESIEPMNSLVDSETTLDIKKKIGSGTFSNVYSANFKKDRESPLSNYAIKFFTDIKTGPDDFDVETTILSVLRGTTGVINVEFIVLISVLGKTCFAYGMPYFQNGTLYDYAKRLSKGEILKMLGPLAEILRKCHDNGVFHCDIKPPNILINDQGNLVLADFGIGESCNRKHWCCSIQNLIYTPWYRDPWNWDQEIRNGLNFKVSIYSEIWALLLSFIHVLSLGRFEGNRFFSVFRDGNYFSFHSQTFINEAIDVVFSSSSFQEPCSLFFKKWLDIQRFMRITTTIPMNHPTFFDDLYQEFFHDFGLVIDAMNRQTTLQPSKTESSDDDDYDSDDYDSDDDD